MFHTVITPENESELVFTLPNEFLHKKVEITAYEQVDNLPGTEENIENGILVNNALERVKHLRRSTQGFKFNREEANER